MMKNTKKIFDEFNEHGCIELDYENCIICTEKSIEYLFEQLLKEREINKEFHECFNNNVKSQEINDLLNAYHHSIALSTDLINRIVKENKQLKEQLKQKHCLNSCLLHVITTGGVKEDGSFKSRD